jgi:hypothetical protein
MKLFAALYIARTFLTFISVWPEIIPTVNLDPGFSFQETIASSRICKHSLTGIANFKINASWVK